MGRKQIGPRKYIFYSIACLISLSLFRCAAIDELRTREEAKGGLRQGHKLLALGNYEGALDKYQKVLALSSRKPPEDEALFYIGLIYASSRYPKRDTKKSMDFFTDILNDWPQSPFVEQAKIWLGILHENERMNLLVKRMRPHEAKPPETKPVEVKAEDVAEGRESQTRSQRLLAAGDFEGFISENQRVLSPAHPRSSKDEALFNLGLVYAHEGNPKKDFLKSLDFFKRLIHDHPRSPLVEQAKIWVGLLQEYESLNQVIQKLKQVDIEVEERKREKAK
ncbi:MAG TPA: tetratricopeptide repeat protein [Thermodesulfobacteriota bacterium]|jgi:tetratricopeptide (TPR) repeat protein|nr:tetratricopeptide repeat protein [Thermodesulfobacteriota bacterium]